MEKRPSRWNCTCYECEGITKFFSIPKLCDIDMCLNHLTEIDLSSSDISDLPDSIGSFVNIVRFDLSSNKLDTLPQAFTKFDRLIDLNLSYNNFQLMPQCLIDGMHLVAKLDLSHNKLLDIGKKPFCVQRLVTLNVGYNSLLTSLPNWLWSIECISLKSLDISFTNCLENIEFDPYLRMYGIGNHLEYLDASDTNSNVLKLDFIRHLKNLKTLVLDNKGTIISLQNWFTTVPLVFNCRFKSITNLSLRNVNLSTIGEKLYFYLPNLQMLNLSENYIVQLPDTLSKLTNLEVCDFSNNTIVLIPECFKSLKNLKRLVLNNNWLSSFPNILEDLSNLEYLDLYHNNIVACPLWNLNSNIKSIDLEHNIFSSENSIDQNSKVNYDKMLNSLRLSINESRMTGPLCCAGDEEDAETYFNKSSTQSNHWSSHSSHSDRVHSTDEERQVADDFQSEEYWECNPYELTTDIFDPKEFEANLFEEFRLEKSLTFDEYSKEVKISKNYMHSSNDHYFCPSDEYNKNVVTT